MNSKKSGSRIVKVSNDWKKDGKALTYLEWKKQVFSHPICHVWKTSVMNGKQSLIRIIWHSHDSGFSDIIQ